MSIAVLLKHHDNHLNDMSTLMTDTRFFVPHGSVTDD
jgi:hypothetical protein